MRYQEWSVWASAALTGAAGMAHGVAVGPPDDREQDRISSLVQRAAPPRLGRRWRPVRDSRFPYAFRSIDGSGNNQVNPGWGAAGEVFLRRAQPGYADGLSLPAGEGRPSARAVSNAVHAQASSLPNAAGASDWLWQWGQFIDHDLDETPIASPKDPFDIAVPAGDPFFDPFSTGAATIKLDRSGFETVGGVREQLNIITAYIDASMVYGSDEERARALRTGDGTGRLLTSEGDLLPFNTLGLPNAPRAADPAFFVAGDVRASEQVGLTAVHTLFVREHNWWAGLIAEALPGLSGDEIYEWARAIVAAEIQAITYNEFLPLLLGDDALPPYRGYDPSVNAGVTNEFAAAAYRVGHTMLSPVLLRLGPDLEPIAEGNLALRDAFFVPAETVAVGIDPVLLGLARQRAQTIDRFVIDDVRNFLFGPPGAGGFDLPALNIQRGRDHGLGSYNDTREAFGLPRAASFADITPDPASAAALASVYASPDDVDAWPGMLSEPHRPGALVGPTLFRVLRDQFLRARDGDRFWYQRYLPASLAAEVDATTLADVIRRNSGIGDELQADAFRVPVACPADLNGDGRLDGLDIAAFVRSFLSGGASADLNGDGRLNGLDIALFVRSLATGCGDGPGH